MTKFMSAAFAASLLVSAVSVQAEVRETVRVTVRHHDLDLHRADHRAMLGARIRRAAAIACGPLTQDVRGNADVSRCRAEMRANGAVQIAALSDAPVALASAR